MQTLRIQVKRSLVCEDVPRACPYLLDFSVSSAMMSLLEVEGKMKILIAEDNRALQNVIGEFMDFWGFDFDLASNGREAVNLAKINEGKYDLCLMDIDMPVMNGFEATKNIRQKIKYLPVMALTGNLAAADDYLKVGMDDYLQKPYNPEKLYDKISELTVKVVTVHKEQNRFIIRKEMPVNSEELNELRELDRKGLTKFSLIDTGHKFIVHKNLQNKISHDFIAKRKLLSEFLDRSTDDPGIIHLYASNLHASKRHILPDILEALIQEEDNAMKDYTMKAEYPEKEKTE